MVNAFYHNNNRVVRVQPEELEGIIKSDQGVIWIDLEDPSDLEEDLILGKLLKVHPLAIEDARNRSTDDTPHPKLEDFSEYLFMIVHAMQLLENKQKKMEEQEFNIGTFQLNTFLFGKMIVTHHYKKMKSIDDVAAQCQKDPKILGTGPDYLFFQIIDSIFDSYVPLVERMDQYVEIYEDEVFINNGKQAMQKILRFKKNVVKIRRVSLYHREILSRLAFGNFPLITEDEKAYYRNAFNRLSRMVDLTDTYKDSVAELLDAYLSVTSENQNQVMKFLTLISTIFLPLSVITGFYGMNLAFLPGANSFYSFILVTSLMIVVAAFMMYFFRKNKWI